MNVEQNEQIRIASIECSIKFCSSCYSSLNALDGLEALFNLVIEFVSSATTLRKKIVQKCCKCEQKQQ